MFFIRNDPVLTKASIKNCFIDHDKCDEKCCSGKCSVGVSCMHKLSPYGKD